MATSLAEQLFSYAGNQVTGLYDSLFGDGTANLGTDAAFDSPNLDDSGPVDSSDSSGTGGTSLPSIGSKLLSTIAGGTAATVAGLGAVNSTAKQTQQVSQKDNDPFKGFQNTVQKRNSQPLTPAATSQVQNPMAEWMKIFGGSK
jgi:hypothetical protein